MLQRGGPTAWSTISRALSGRWGRVMTEGSHTGEPCARGRRTTDTRDHDSTGSGSLGKNTSQEGVTLLKAQSSSSPRRKIFYRIQGSRGLTSRPSGEDEAPLGRTRWPCHGAGPRQEQGRLEGGAGTRGGGIDFQIFLVKPYLLYNFLIFILNKIINVHSFKSQVNPQSYREQCPSLCLRPTGNLPLWVPPLFGIYLQSSVMTVLCTFH